MGRLELGKIPAPKSQHSKGSGKLSVPVRFADKLLPTVHANRMARVSGTPVRSFGRFSQIHSSLFRSSVCFAVIAFNASQNTVFPSRLATLCTRHDMVDRQFVGARSYATVLAFVLVSLKDVAPTERYVRLRQTIETSQRYDLRSTDQLTSRNNGWLTVDRTHVRPI